MSEIIIPNNLEFQSKNDWVIDTAVNLVFLDFDGVLNSQQYFKERPKLNPNHPRWEWVLHQIDSKSIKILNEIGKIVPYSIVISSTWRKIHPLDELKKLLKQKGLKVPIIGTTPVLLGRFRGEEVETWIEDAISKGIKIKNFCAIDDDSDFDNIRDRLVLTKNEFGLTEHYKQQIIDLLSK